MFLKLAVKATILLDLHHKPTFAQNDNLYGFSAIKLTDDDINRSFLVTMERQFLVRFFNEPEERF